MKKSLQKLIRFSISGLFLSGCAATNSASLASRNSSPVPPVSSQNQYHYQNNNKTLISLASDIYKAATVHSSSVLETEENDSTPDEGYELPIPVSETESFDNLTEAAPSFEILDSLAFRIKFGSNYHFLMDKNFENKNCQVILSLLSSSSSSDYFSSMIFTDGHHFFGLYATISHKDFSQNPSLKNDGCNGFYSNQNASNALGFYLASPVSIECQFSWTTSSALRMSLSGMMVDSRGITLNYPIGFSVDQSSYDFLGKGETIQPRPATATLQSQSGIVTETNDDEGKTLQVETQQSHSKIQIEIHDDSYGESQWMKKGETIRFLYEDFGNAFLPNRLVYFGQEHNLEKRGFLAWR